ncbi:MAG: hypothetical protein V4683_08200 [Bacteroidota bacterium]
MSNLTVIDQIVHEIYTIQKNADQRFWNEGIFPNTRLNKIIGYSRPDNSIFHTASIVLILKNCKEYLSIENQKVVEDIIEKSTLNYIDYQNKNGILTYNFYPSKPSKHFGNGLFFKHFKHFQLPDDADDTALIFLSKPHSTLEVQWLQTKLKEHSNNGLKKIKNTFPQYKNLGAYSTWFGKNMPLEFDTCVLANVLLCLKSASIELDDTGLASWEYIKESILSDDYISNPFLISHNYADSLIIAYHVARLLEKNIFPNSQEVKEKLIDDLLNFSQKNKTFNNILISSSLLRLGIDYKITFGFDEIKLAAQDFYFFKAGLLSSYENYILQKLAKYTLFHIHWACPAHGYALALENLILQNQFKKNA